MARIKRLFFRVRLEYKILFVLAAGLALGFGSYVIYTIQSESSALLNQNRQKAHLFAESLKSGIRNVMLSGRPSYVRSLIEEAREEFRGIGHLRLFNNESMEIFPDRGKFTTAITDNQAVISMVRGEEQGKGASSEYVLLKNEKRCQACHGTDHTVRGAIRLEFAYSEERAAAAAGDIIRQAFESIMLSGKGETADELMKEVEGLDHPVKVQIYDKDGFYTAFGDDRQVVPESILEEASSTLSAEGPSVAPMSFPSERGEVIIFGLENRESCQVCHGSDHSIRGMLALTVERNGEGMKELPEMAAVAGFRNMMLMERGMYAGEYVEMVRQLSFVKRFQVFDNGRKHPDGVQELFVPDTLFQGLVKDDSVEHLVLEVNRHDSGVEVRRDYLEELEDGATYLTQIIPLVNNEKCQACHNPPLPGSPEYERYGDRWKVRSVVKISTSMKPILGEIRQNVFASIATGVLTVLVVGIMLRIFIRIVVLKPLNIIGSTAQEVGGGNLAVTSKVKSEDEIGILSHRINDMIGGLRERLHLTRFVSEETVRAVSRADLEGVALGGERKEGTVLFSDIRGFTAYSETVEPETVVDMLNTFLNGQAQIVRQFDGDIDKFVGDELMAVFQGENMIENAIRCSIALQQKVAVLNRDYGAPIGVGIGINAGPMVMGAVGSVHRMDYTVLGDNVNLGARLCSSAKSGEIIISKQSVEMMKNRDRFDMKEREPISVKGKTNPVEIYEVRYESA